MKRPKTHIIATLLLLAIFVTPQIIFAADSVFGNFIQCGNIDQHACGYNDLIILFKNVINGLIELATIITTGVLAYAGFTLITSGGDEGAYKKGVEMLKKTVWGYFWVLVAWTLVYTITSVLLNPATTTTLLGKPN